MKKHYMMKVDITDPKTPEGMFSGLHLDLDCWFNHKEDDYGNGWRVAIVGEDSHIENYYDLRYDENFSPDNAEEWLRKWAEGYWTGKNGAWAIRTLSITEA